MIGTFISPTFALCGGGEVLGFDDRPQILISIRD